MTDPTITVLTAVRNGGRFLAETIESVVQQTQQDWEYLIVDDASTDDTVEIANAFALSDDRIRVIRRADSGGPYAAANEGLRQARGRYVARIDADDVALPHRLSVQLRFLRQHPQLRACAGFWQLITEESDVSPDVRMIPASPRVIPWFLCVKSGFVHSTAFVEHACLEEIGGYRELPVSQDYRLWCVLARRGWLGVVPQVLVYWRRHESSISTRSYDKQVLAHVDILQEHLTRMTGETWGRSDADSLFRVSHARPMSIGEGLDILERWESAWREAPSLSRRDRRELARLALRLRLRHLRWNGPRHPGEFPQGLARTILSGVR